MAFASGEPSAEPGPKQITVNVGGQQVAAEVVISDGKVYIDIDSVIAMLGVDTGAVTWQAYQQYLIDAGAANAPNKDEMIAQVNALTSWDDVDLTTSPWDQLFTTVGLSTWPEFVLTGGNGAASVVVGTAMD